MKGSLVMTLDNSRTLVNSGDAVVQQGTMHGCYNDTNEWARRLVVLTPAKASVINGKVMATDAATWINDRGLPGGKSSYIVLDRALMLLRTQKWHVSSWLYSLRTMIVQSRAFSLFKIVTQ